MKTSSRRGAPLAAGIALLAGCAGTPGPAQTLESRLAERGYRMGPAVERIADYRINGFNSVDDEHLILDTGPSSRYLVSLMVPCNGLPYAEQIGFTATGTELTRFDKLVVKEQAITQHCPIEQIHKLEQLPREPKQGS